MNISWITLRDLEYLAAVATHEHFGKAAAACHVSQPTLSAQIKKIENLLDVLIFERTNRKVAITEQGRKIVDQARITLEEARKIISVAKDKKAALSGSFRLGAIATLGPYYIPHILQPLKTAFPKLNLVLREGLTHELLGELKNGELDAVLAAPTFDESGFRTFPLFYEPFQLFCPHEHKLSTKEHLAPSDLRASDMVLLEDGHCLKDQTLDFCPANRRGNIRHFHATSIETLRHLVAAGHGYTLIPELAVTDDTRISELATYRKFSRDKIGRMVILVCRERFARLDEITALSRFLLKTRPKGTLPAATDR